MISNASSNKGRFSAKREAGISLLLDTVFSLNRILYFHGYYSTERTLLSDWKYESNVEKKTPRTMNNTGINTSRNVALLLYLSSLIFLQNTEHRFLQKELWLFCASKLVNLISFAP